MIVTEFQEVQTGKKFSIKYKEQPLGEGAQGSIHEIIEINGTLYATWVLKFLKVSNSALETRLHLLTDTIKDKKLDSEGLSCIPAVLLRTSFDNKLAIPMRFANGNDLSYGLPTIARPLTRQLAAAYELAHSVNRLHSAGFVLGDLALDNLIIDPNNWALYLIDIDGSGFQWIGTPYPVIAHNGPKGSVCPPEHKDHLLYTQEMDLWGLAILLHFVLTGQEPMDSNLFGLGRTYADPGVRWPPSGHPKEGAHLQLLDGLGKPLKNAFIKSFNQGKLTPKNRLSAEDWERLLSKAQNFVYACQCSLPKPYVALDENGRRLEKCPKCGESIMPHPWDQPIP